MAAAALRTDQAPDTEAATPLRTRHAPDTLDDPLARLEILEKYLDQRKLLG